MVITIGEVINEITQHARQIEVNMYSDFPCIKVYLGESASITKACLYIAQVAEHVYSAADTDGIYIGHRYIFTGNTNKPFVLEKDFLDHTTSNLDPNVKLNMSYRETIEWVYDKMWSYGIIKFNPSEYPMKFSELGFNSTKIRRILDKSFSHNHCDNGTIAELIDLVNRRKKPFSLDGLYEREIRCVYAKLKSIGLIATIVDDKITMINFDYKR